MLLSWGANSYGQLGQKHKDDQFEPREVPFDKSQRITCISGGGGHTFIVTAGEEVWCCGSNKKGELAIDEKKDYTEFQQIPSLHGIKIKKVACGWDFTVALSCNGQVYCWGSNTYGQLGISNEAKNVHCDKPVLLQAFIDKEVTDISAGLRHSAAIADHEIWCWGSNKKGQLGSASEQSASDSLLNCVPAPSSEKFINVVCGAYHTIALSDKGNVYGWGSNNKGQLSLNPQDTKLSSEPVKLQVCNIKQIHSGWTHIIALNNEHCLLSWGRGDYGQLGRNCPSIGYCYVPQMFYNEKPVMMVTGGAEHNFAITLDNTLLSWGWNEHGMCGVGHTENVLQPTPVSLPDKQKIVCVGSGSGHSFVAIEK